MAEEGNEPGEEGQENPSARPASSSSARASSSAEPGKPGRPSAIESLTVEQRARFMALLQTGSPLNFSCREVGVFSEDSYNDWKKKAAAGDERYVEFIRDAEQARARHVISNLAMIGKSEDWRARAWLLERLHPKEFAPLQKQEHSGPEGTPLGAPVMILPAIEVEEFAPPLPPDEDA